MKGKSTNKAEKEWQSKVCDLGCIVCFNEHRVFSPPSPHHTNGRTKKGAHYEVIPLCYIHHQSDDNNPNYVSFHQNKSEFEKRYGTQAELLKQVRELLNE